MAILIGSCKRSEKGSEFKSDSTQRESKSKDPDSIKLNNQLNRALQIANENIENDDFSESFEVVFDSNKRILTQLTIKDHFANGRSLIVLRKAPDVYIDIFLKKDNVYKKILNYEQSAMTYLNDTIQDVNGDGRKDFLINWYGGNGCCLKNFINVYLQLPDSTFSEKFEFINPTFSVSEKVVRGVTYGHQGESELYKYKWNNLRIDTIEFIYHGKIGDGHYIKSKHRSHDRRNKQKDNISLRLIPDEYFGIYGYDWFTNTRTRE